MAEDARAEAPNEAPESPAEAPSNAYANYVLGLLFVVYVFNFIDRQILSILLQEDPEGAAYIGGLLQRWHDVDAKDADDPTIPGALRYLANLNFDAHRFDTAAEFAALVGETDPHGRTLQGLVALLQEDTSGAREHLAAADPDGAAVIQGHLSIAERDRAAAEAALRSIATRDAPTDGKVDTLRYEQTVWRMANLGMAWAASNDDEHAVAIRHYDRALSVTPDDIFALLGKGNALAAMRQLDDAEALFERVLEAHPGNPYALAELGLVDYNRGDLAAAEARFQAALEADPTGYTCPHEGLGLVYLKQGKTAEAAAAFEQAIEINPEIEYKKFNGLAQIYIDQGRYDEARALLKQSIENYPFDDEAAQMLAELEGR